MESKISDDEYSKAQEETIKSIDEIFCQIQNVFNFIYSDSATHMYIKYLEDKKEGKQKDLSFYTNNHKRFFEVKAENFINSLNTILKKIIKDIKNQDIFTNAFKQKFKGGE